MKMFKIILTGLGAAVCFSIGQTVFASTNDIHLDVLLTAQGNFTNATIIRHNPAYAIVFYPYGAGMVRVADSNLPPDLQKQFDYSPSNAAAFLESENENATQAAKAYAAKRTAERAYVASLNGTNSIYAEPHTWVLKTGETVTGDYVSSGTTALVIKTGGTNCFLKISNLSIKDQAYTFKMQVAQRQARLDAETNQMAMAGMLELTAKFIANFPEKADANYGWMDVEFEELNPIAVDFPDIRLGFDVRDKNGDLYTKCNVKKELPGKNYPSDIFDTMPNPLASDVSNLKRGDKVRLVGFVSPLSINDDLAAHPRLFFSVEKVEIIETAAEKDFIKQQDTTTP